MKERAPLKVISSSSTRTTIVLEEFDAALILKADGTLQASLPDIKTDTVPENVLTAASVVYALNDIDLCNLIRKNFIENCLDSDGEIPEPKS